jgi:hypothetical protein
MRLEHATLLQIQRDLYELPRGWERFNAYLATMTAGTGDAELLLLVAMNPMAREHVAARLDSRLAIDAEAVAAAALHESHQRLTGVSACFVVRKLSYGRSVMKTSIGGIA